MPKNRKLKNCHLVFHWISSFFIFPFSMGDFWAYILKNRPKSGQILQPSRDFFWLFFAKPIHNIIITIADSVDRTLLLLPVLWMLLNPHRKGLSLRNCSAAVAADTLHFHLRQWPIVGVSCQPLANRCHRPSCSSWNALGLTSESCDLNPWLTDNGDERQRCGYWLAYTLCYVSRKPLSKV